MQYLIKDDGTKQEPVYPPKLMIVGERAAWDAIDNAFHEDKRIAVYALECVIDWS